MSIECERVDGINLAQGVCDTEAPLAVREEACRGIENGTNSYTRFDGLVALREAIAHKLQQHNGITGLARDRHCSECRFNRGVLLCLPCVARSW